jgi:hypothetical protein
MLCITGESQQVLCSWRLGANPNRPIEISRLAQIKSYTLQQYKCRSNYQFAHSGNQGLTSTFNLTLLFSEVSIVCTHNS